MLEPSKSVLLMQYYHLKENIVLLYMDEPRHCFAWLRFQHLGVRQLLHRFPETGSMFSSLAVERSSLAALSFGFARPVRTSS